MWRTLVRVAVLSLIAVLLTIGVLAQVSFRAESPRVPIGDPGCVQVGLFLNVSGMNQQWAMLVATLDYAADPGVLADAPMARVSDFPIMSVPVLTNPATFLPPHGWMGMSPCSPENTTNSVILTGGMPIPFISGSGRVMVSENINPMTQDSGRIGLLAGGDFETRLMQDDLFAVLTFPVTGQPGSIRITFSNAMPGANALIDRNMMTVSATTTAGGVQLGGASSDIPTLSEWCILAFLSGLLLSALVFLRRRSIVS